MDLKKVIYLSRNDYLTLISTGTVTINGSTLTYDAANLYIVPDEDIKLSDLGGINFINASGTSPLNLNATVLGTTATIVGSIAKATTSAVGVVKVGNGLSINNDGEISVVSAPMATTAEYATTAGYATTA